MKFVEVKEIKIFEFNSGNWIGEKVEIRKNDIVKIEYKCFGNTIKTITGRFVDLVYSSFSKNDEEELKLNQVVVLDTSKEFFAQEENIPLSEIVYIEKIK